MLEDVMVVEVGERPSTAYCGKLLFDAGATVIRLEPDDGDPVRTRDPGYAAYLHGGKQSVTGGWDAVSNFAERIDMLLFDDDTSSSHELASALRRLNPALVVITMSDYGLTGPDADTPATEFTLQAEAGVMVLHDTGGRPPVATGVPLAELTAGISGAAGAVVALLARDAGAEGVDVDVSRFEGLVETLLYPWLFDAIEGHNPYPVPSQAIPGIEQASDGWVCVVSVTPQQWIDFKRLARIPELDDPRFDTLDGRVISNDEVTPLVRRFTMQHTVAELVELGAANRVPIVPVGRPDTLHELPPYASRETFVRNEAGFLQPRPPFRFGGDDQGWAPGALAAVGANTARPVMPQRGRTSRRNDGADPTRPLVGVRVVEFGVFQAGPLVTMNLAALGADVIKVEAVTRPDMIRFAGIPMSQNRAWERGGVFNASNLGKRAINVDLADARGREVARRLIATSDVVLDNYSPRVLEAAGLDADAIRALRPDAVVVRLPAWGLTGPWRDRPGFTYTADATSGIAEMTGYPDGPPMLTGTIVDPIAALTTTFATLAALRRRQITDEGAYLTVALCDVAPQLTARAVIETSHTGNLATRHGNNTAGVVPQGTYRGADGTWVAISVANDEQWRAFASLPDTKTWAADDRFANVAGRTACAAELDAALAEWCARDDASAIMALLRTAGVPAAVVATGTALSGHPQLLARGRVFTVTHPVIGSQQYLARPFRLSHDPTASASGPAPLFGQHNTEVLTELGYGTDEIQAMFDAGLLGTSPFGAPYDAT